MGSMLYWLFNLVKLNVKVSKETDGTKKQCWGILTFSFSKITESYISHNDPNNLFLSEGLGLYRTQLHLVPEGHGYLAPLLIKESLLSLNLHPVLR